MIKYILGVITGFLLVTWSVADMCDKGIDPLLFNTTYTCEAK